MPERPADHPGLCGDCSHAIVQESAKGQKFWRCGAADERDDLRRYPPLPVMACAAYEATDSVPGA